MSSSIVVRPTEREAFDYLDYYAVDHADLLAVASLQRDSELPARLRIAAGRRAQGPAAPMVAGSFNMQILVGTPEQIVDRLINLSRAWALDGLNMTFVNYQDEAPREWSGRCYRCWRGWRFAGRSPQPPGQQQ